MFLLFVTLALGADKKTGKHYHGRSSTLRPSPPSFSTGPNQLIVGGFKAKNSLRKRLALVVIETRAGDVFSCTGSVISRKYILCAAHCFISSGKMNKVYAKKSYVLIGERGTDIKYFDNPANKYFMESVYVDRRYRNNGLFRYDVAVIELKKKISQSRYVPMSLGDAPSGAPGGVIVSGYGARGSFKNSGKSVMQAKVIYQNWDVCNKQLGFSVANSEEEEVCSTSKGFPEVGKTGICFGDSGGPIMRKSGDRYIQYGIASYFYGWLCEDSGSVFVHQRVSEYRSRIDSLVRSGRKTGWKRYR